MTQILLVAGVVIASLGLFPYLRDIVRRKTKPRIVTWFNWTLLTGIATAAALAEQQYASAALTGSGTICTGIIVLLSLKYNSDRKFEAFDILCQLGAIIGLVLWIIFNNPLIALIASMTIDFIVGLPTWRHAWRKPFEETTLTFVLAGVGSFCSLLAAILSQDLLLSGLIFPAYLTLNNLIVTGLILLSPRRHGR